MNYEDFPVNKYSKWYVALIESRKKQVKEYFETEAHHIFPVSIYDKNDLIVNLTYREHFIAHLLLWKMFRSEFGDTHRSTIYMCKAIRSFDTMNERYGDNILSESKLNSRIFQKIRKEFRIINSEQTRVMWQDPKMRAHLTKCRQEYWGSEEAQEQQSLKRKEWFSDPENLKKQTEINREITSRPEWRDQRSKKQKELSSDPEYNAIRVKALATPEAKAKSKAVIAEQIALMSDEQRKKRFDHSSMTMWITNGIESEKIKNDVVIPEGWRRGRTLKKNQHKLSKQSRSLL